MTKIRNGEMQKPNVHYKYEYSQEDSVQYIMCMCEWNGIPLL